MTKRNRCKVEYKHYQEWIEEGEVISELMIEFIDYCSNYSGIVSCDSYQINRQCEFDNILVQEMWDIWQEAYTRGLAFEEK